MRRKPRSDGGYYIAPKLMQMSVGLALPHRRERCTWCLAYAQGREKQPCPDQPQMELFA